MSKPITGRLYESFVAKEDPVLMENVYNKKTFWDCGVYGTLVSNRYHGKVVLPLPMYHSDDLFNTDEGFKLRWDIWYAREHGLLTRHRDPPPFIKIRSSKYMYGNIHLSLIYIYWIRYL
jgi:hypothetical protein